MCEAATASGTRRFYAKSIAMVYGAWIVAFSAVAAIASGLPETDLSTPLDELVPFVPGFVWLYDACFLLPIVPLLVQVDRARLNRMLLAFVTANLAAFTPYLLLRVAPAKPPLEDSLAEAALAAQYRIDWLVGANNLPSMHVVFAWMFFLLMRGHGRVADTLQLGIAVAITVSTLFVKMHLVADVVFGVAWAFASWLAAGRLFPELLDDALRPPERLQQAARRLPRVTAVLGAVAVVAGVLRRVLS